MAQVVNGRIKLDREESENFLRMFYHPDLEMLRRRDTWLSEENEDVSVIKSEEGFVTAIVINNLIF